MGETMPVEKKVKADESKAKTGTNDKKSSKKSSIKKPTESIVKKSTVKAHKKSLSAKKSATTKKIKKVVKKTSFARKRKKNDNLTKLYHEMNKLAKDAVDKEVTKRFKTLIDTADDDITKTLLRTIMKDPRSVEFSKLHESLHPYVKHYIFMSKRNKNIS